MKREREYRGKCSPSSPFDLSQAPGTESLSFVIITRPSTGKGSLFGGAGLFLAYLRLHLIARFVHCSFRLFLPPPVLSSFFEHLPRNFVRKGEGPYFFTSLANVKCLVYIDPFLSREKVNLPFLFILTERWRNLNRGKEMEGILKEWNLNDRVRIWFFDRGCKDRIIIHSRKREREKGEYVILRFNLIYLIRRKSCRPTFTTNSEIVERGK